MRNQDDFPSLRVVYRFIWECLLDWARSYQVELARKDERDGKTPRVTHMEALISTYPESPLLTRVVEEFAIQVDTLGYCMTQSGVGVRSERARDLDMIMT